MEELSRATINEWWEAHEKPDDYVLTRGEYKELAEFVVPEAKPVEDETMDELVAQCDNGLVRKEEAMRVLSKARSYLRTHRELEALYDRVVAGGDAYAGKGKVMPLMLEMTKPYPNMPELNDDDVHDLWAGADTNGDGKISRAELLLSLATWRDTLVRAYNTEATLEADGTLTVKPKTSSSMCLIL